MPGPEIDAIIDEMMLRNYAKPVVQPRRNYPANYVAPRDVTRRQMGPVSKMWEGVGKRLFSDAEATEARLGPYRPYEPQTQYASTAPPQPQPQQFPAALDYDPEAVSFATRWPLEE